jgi:uncharacterized membrane protein YeaQ/YmgE (transglycosylase-associated protein family)
MSMVPALRLPRSSPMTGALGAAALGLIGCIVGLAVAPQAAARAWLAAFVFCASVPLGALILLAVGPLSRARWVAALQPTLRAGSAMLPVLALAFIPVLAGSPWLYPWTAASSPTHSLYLNLPFFVLRSIVYFAIWAGLWLGLPRPTPAPAALILLLFSLSFAAIDWLMSLDAPWSSSVYGLLVSAAWVSIALAGTALLYAGNAKPERETLHALGTMLFAATLVTAYLAFMQFLIVWEENLPDEIVWYARRTGGGWSVVLGANILCQFAAPFLLLLFRRVKASPRGLGLAAASALLGGWLGFLWLVAGDQRAWLDLAALLALGGLIAVALLRRGDIR